MGEQLFEEQLEKLQEWIGQKLSSCPTRDGIAFYHRTDKVLKAVRQNKGWYLQFNVPVPECPGLLELSPEEVRKKKLGKTHWLYKGDSDADARELVLAALDGLPHRQLIDPAMSREVNTVSRATCPCFKKMERLASAPVLPEDIRSFLQNAYEILLAGNYVRFLQMMRDGMEDVTSFLLQKQGLEAEGMDISAKVKKLVDLKIVSKSLRDEVELLYPQRKYEEFYSVPERAYPMALILISLLSRLVKSCA